MSETEKPRMKEVKERKKVIKFSELKIQFKDFTGRSQGGNGRD